MAWETTVGPTSSSIRLHIYAVTYMTEISLIVTLNNKFTHSPIARRGGAEVAGWTLDRKIRVRFPAYPHRVWALWWQGGKKRRRTSRCRGRLSTLKTPSCPWRGCPAAGQNLETGHLSRHYIAEISLNVTLNRESTTTTTTSYQFNQSTNFFFLSRTSWSLSHEFYNE